MIGLILKIWLLRLESAKAAWLTHVVGALVIQGIVAGPVALLHGPSLWWLGAALAIGFFWSREKTEVEFELKEAAGGNTVGPYWNRGWFPWSWDMASQWQFYAPAIAVIAVALAVPRL